MKTYSSKFNAQRAATVAGHDPEAVEIEKTPQGFVWRPITPPPAEAEPAPVVLKPAPSAASSPRRARFAASEAAARAGVLPEPPDFSAATHARFRGKLARVVALTAEGDIAGLRAVEINPISTSPKALAVFRDLCVVALEARATGA